MNQNERGRSSVIQHKTLKKKKFMEKDKVEH